MAASPISIYRNYTNTDWTSNENYTNMTPLPSIDVLGWTPPEGSEFKEWNTNRDGSGTSFQPGDVTDYNVYAIWKVSVKYQVSESQLNFIADAINTKAGTTGQLQFPNGFVSAIQNIPSGGDLDDFIANHGTISNFEGSTTAVGDGAFAYCYSLITASFPNCTTIGRCAFQSCSKLTTISFPNCTSINEHAFASCSKLTTASFPNCTTIGSSAFYYCSSLTTISFPNCTTIDYAAFYECKKITTASFPNCTLIGLSAFAYCSSLTTISFPNCTSINASAFFGCSKLTTVNFPKCMTIGYSAFASCYSITTASFPNCTTINGCAFNKCYKLLSLYLLGSSVAKLDSVNAFWSTPISSYTTSTGGVQGSIFVPSSLYNTYITSTNWVNFSARFVSV